MMARILVVEDDPSYGEFVVDLLTDESYQAVLAKTLAEAITALGEGEFGLVLTDMRLVKWTLDDRSGFAVARAALQKQIPCIVMSHMADPADVRSALSATEGIQARDFFLKGRGGDTLLAMIKKVMGV